MNDNHEPHAVDRRAPEPAPPVWDDGSWTSLPTLRGDSSAHSCVIGLGGTGLTLIAELLARAENVIGLDARDVGGGAAGRNGGFLLAGCYDFYHDAIERHGARRATRIYEATIGEIERIRMASPTAVQRVGSKRLAASAEELADCRKHYDALRADGFPAQWYAGDDGEGLFLPTDGAFNPLARCRQLAQEARDEGARLFANSPVLRFDGTRVITPHGIVHAERVFVTVDGALDVLLPELAGRVRTARLQMLATEPLAPGRIACPVYHREGFEYWQQLPDGRVALGGYRDQGGDAEWTTDMTPSPVVQGLLERHLREQLHIDAPITHRWAASAGYTDTGLPVLEQVRPGLWAAGGYSGTGNVIGALAARALASAAIDGDSVPAQMLLGDNWEPRVTHGRVTSQ
ncbi:MAG: FAD-binding oxidoreductase [Gemmatimonadaceae bacterium]|nr:FAD-binding oxidoreductase [Gemmatimonadaceae bacterium]